MIHYLSNMFDPMGYHGHGMRPPFFEGWYYKCISADGRHRLALIPGVHRTASEATRHAFIQVLDGERCEAQYARYDLADFRPAKRGLNFELAGSHFGAERLQLHITIPGYRLQGALRFGEMHPWPVTLASPGAMGWYAWAPFMECYHGVGSMDHRLEGALELNGRRMVFDGGRGYLEKDWGRSFPSAYVWMQSNHFRESGTSLMASIAVIPWLRGSRFRGFIIGWLWRGRLLRLATYTGAHLESLKVEDQRICWRVADRRHRMSVVAQRASGGLLQGPGEENMGLRVAETLSGQLHVVVEEQRQGRWEKIVDDTGLHAGIDAAGHLEQLLISPEV